MNRALKRSCRGEYEVCFQYDASKPRTACALTHSRPLFFSVHTFLEPRRLKDVVVVLERSSTARHYEAVCRTCECLGVQNVWILEHPPPRKLEECPTREAAEKLEESFKLPKPGSGIFKKARKFLSVRHFNRTRDLMDACKEEGLDVSVRHNIEKDATPVFRP